MKHTLLGVMFVVIVALAFTTRVGTQYVEWFPGFSGGAIDYEVQASPCGASQTINASPFLLRDQVWLAYLCADNRVVMRAFMGARPGPTINDTDIVCPGTFVHTTDKQGCVPPNHPLAPRARHR